MTSLVPYLVFSGSCKEAMEFYRETLNGEITILQTFKESHLDVPVELQDRIFNSELRAGNICFKASDDLPSHEVKIGSNISLYIVFSSRKTQREVFKKLSEADGRVLFPMEGSFGMLVDKYGVQWMVNCDENSIEE